MNYFIYIIVGFILLAAIIMLKLANVYKTQKDKYMLTAYWLHLLSLIVSWFYLLVYYYFVKENIFVSICFILLLIPFYYYVKNLKRSLKSKRVKNKDKSYEKIMDIFIYYLRKWLEIIILILVIFIMALFKNSASFSINEEINNLFNLVHIYILGIPFCLILTLLHWIIAKLKKLL